MHALTFNAMSLYIQCLVQHDILVAYFTYKVGKSSITLLRGTITNTKYKMQHRQPQ